MYAYELRKSLEKEFSKLAKKNPKQLVIIGKKIEEIVSSEDISRYKNLKKPLQHLKRVHIDSSFVLLFSVDEERNTIVFEAFDHHDTIYKN